MTHTPCYLTVLARLSETQIAELAPMLEAMNPDDPDVAEALGENSQIRFEAVFEGDMPMDVMRWFSTNKIAYLWQWESFYGTGAGAQYYEAAIDHLHHIRIHEELAVLSLAEAADPAKVQALRGAVVSLNIALEQLGINKKPF